ncbi:hypothetical protein FDECE_320 [Fusarium decemcellulare]|nr:hypothetical protein FDECE_320 [Fusarium decemcellulare]
MVSLTGLVKSVTITLMVTLPTSLASPLAHHLATRDYESAGNIISPAVVYNNTIVEQRADPHILKHTDGQYYLAATVPAYDKVVLRTASTIQGLQDAEEVTIFERHGIYNGYVWAPELWHIDGKWYVYVALGVNGTWNIRPGVLEGVGDNPLTAKWTVKGTVKTNWETFSLDMHYFEANGVKYLTWAQNDPDSGEGGTGLYLAPMKNPWTVELPATRISYPDLPWERIGHNVNEGAAVIKRGGKLFLAYSASATDHNYRVGLLTADEDADLMDPSSWKKSPTPVFGSNDETSQYGPGHNSFTVSEDGKSDIFVYHDRAYKDIQGDPLNNPDRRTRVQKLYWCADGTPDFGIPVPDGLTPIRLRSSADERLYIRHKGSEQAVAEGNIEELAKTQFRIVEPGLAGRGTVSLESTNLPGQYLYQSHGKIALSENNGSQRFKATASFKQVKGLSDKKGASFKAIGYGNEYIKVGHKSRLEVGHAWRKREWATFYLE